MGRRGPKPKPPHLKILEGNPGRRATADKTPKATASVPRCPAKYAGKPARHIWKSLGKRLADNGILTHLDVFALELLVDGYLAYGEAVKNCDEKQIQVTFRHVRMMLREFGLTPSSRSLVKTADLKDKSKEVEPAARYFA